MYPRGTYARYDDRVRWGVFSDWNSPGYRLRRAIDDDNVVSMRQCGATNLEQSGDEKGSPMNRAIKRGAVNVVQYLDELGVDVGKHALCCAGSASVARYLVMVHGFDVSEGEGRPLLEALRSRNMPVVKCLIELGAKPCVSDALAFAHYRCGLLGFLGHVVGGIDADWVEFLSSLDLDPCQFARDRTHLIHRARHELCLLEHEHFLQQESGVVTERNPVTQFREKQHLLWDEIASLSTTWTPETHGDRDAVDRKHALTLLVLWNRPECDVARVPFEIFCDVLSRAFLPTPRTAAITDQDRAGWKMMDLKAMKEAVSKDQAIAEEQRLTRQARRKDRKPGRKT